MPYRIHIFGASGSGATTLGEALERRLDAPLLDADRYYWLPTDPPFREKRSPSDRIGMIEREIADRPSWILSGSICGWGDPLLDRLTLAVFLRLDPSIRMERILRRERSRYGARIAPGGSMHEAHRDFLAWASSYDTAAAPTRSLDLHESWMRRLPCPVLKLNSEASVDTLVEQVVAYGTVFNDCSH